MATLDLRVDIHQRPNEVADPIRFDRDEAHCAYDREYANRFWRVLVQADRVFKVFRARFIGKCSPVHFFWGAPDLAVTRFSGRPAPEHPGGIPNLPDRVDAGRLLARGQQLRLLARRRPGPPRGLLLLRLSGAGGLRASAGPPRRGVLQPGPPRVPAALRRRPRSRSPPTRRCSTSCRRRTTRPPTSRDGTGAHWSASRRSGAAKRSPTGIHRGVRRERRGHRGDVPLASASSAFSALNGVTSWRASSSLRGMRGRARGCSS